MTLLVADRSSGTIALLSDSRLSFDKDGLRRADAGVRIMACPVRVWDVDDRGVQAPLVFDHPIGIGFTGSNATAMSAVESVRSVLLSLKRIPECSDFSLEGFCRPVARVFEKMGRRFCAAIGEHGLGELVVVGYRPKHARSRAFHTRLDVDDRVVARTTEILVHDRVTFFGSGAKRAGELHGDNANMTTFAVLRAVIEARDEPTVGGPIQYGSVRGLDFEVDAVRCVAIDHERRTMDVRYYWSGIERQGAAEGPSWDDLVRRMRALDPFGEEINRWLSERYDAS